MVNFQRRHLAASKGHSEIVKILAPLTSNPYATDVDGWTPMHWASCRGHTEIVQTLAPLSDNPNAPNKNGDTPIYWAACRGHTEIVKILAPMTDNPNAPNKDGYTPIEVTRSAEIRRILEAFNTSRKHNAGPFVIISNLLYRAIFKTSLQHLCLTLLNICINR